MNGGGGGCCWSQRRGPPSEQLQLPAGFRFYPSDEELVVHYLSRRAHSQPFHVPIIAEIDLYKFDPWDLPEKALFGEKEWYFFSPRDRKYPNGSRPNRAAGSGYWKATGTDKSISIHGGKQKVGVKKALVFYTGKAPKGDKTNWIMHEYRLADGAAKAARRKGSTRLDDWVLCRIYKKMPSAAKLAMKDENESNTFEDMLEPLADIDEKTMNNTSRLRTNFMASQLNNHNTFNDEEMIFGKQETLGPMHYNYNLNGLKQGVHMTTYGNYHGANNQEQISTNMNSAIGKEAMMLDAGTRENKQKLVLPMPNLRTDNFSLYSSQTNSTIESHDSPVNSSIVDEDSSFRDEKLATKVTSIATIPNDHSLQLLLDGLPSPFSTRLDSFQPFTY